MATMINHRFNLRSAPRSTTTLRRFEFLALPAEIRNIIYNYLWADQGVRILNTACSSPPLTRTNRTIRAEGLPLYISLCPWELRINALARKGTTYLLNANTKAWLTEGGAEAIRLTKLGVQVNVPARNFGSRNYASVGIVFGMGGKVGVVVERYTFRGVTYRNRPGAAGGPSATTVEVQNKLAAMMAGKTGLAFAEVESILKVLHLYYRRVRL